MPDITQLDRNFAPTETAHGLHWYDVRMPGIEGQGWTDTCHPFDRLPARAQSVVRDPVWQLSHHAAGLAVRFRTDATAISAQWDLRQAALAMDHMPATGVSGLDLYAWDDGAWQWTGVGRTVASRGVNQVAQLAEGLKPGVRTYRLYLPLYNGVDRVSLGLPPGSTLLADRPSGRPLCFYGTSITQGGCASRPGMAYPAILGRWLDCATINLGFSGNGSMDLELAPLLAELDPSAYVLDALPNMSAAQVTERVERFVGVLRAAHPSTPVVLVENIVYQRARMQLPGTGGHVSKNEALRAAWQRMQAAGVPHLHYVPGEALLGDDGEATVDGVHPTDLGFLRMARTLLPVLRPLVGPAG